MGCRSCGSKGKRFAKDVPILDADRNVIATNYDKLKRLSTHRPTKRVRITKEQRAKANIKTNIYPNLHQIESTGQRINVLTYNTQCRCIYIVGYMEGCGSCNYMRRLINKIITPELQAHITAYVLDKTITDPTGFTFTGNPTILFVDKGKLVFQVGGIYNKIGDKIAQYYMR